MKRVYMNIYFLRIKISSGKYLKYTLDRILFVVYHSNRKVIKKEKKMTNAVKTHLRQQIL